MKQNQPKPAGAELSLTNPLNEVRANPLRPKPPGKYRFLDIFAGVGGFRFGFEPAGGACVWSCEINSHARKTYSVNHEEPEDSIFPDLREAKPQDIPDHEVLIAGFPCQPFSIAGVSKNNSLNKPNGFRDVTRGTLFFQIASILATHQPVAFLLENVPSLVKHDHGRTFRTILDILSEELGYHTSYRILDSKHYVPQRRSRLFIAGHREKDRPTLDLMNLHQDQPTPNLRSILHSQNGTEAPEEPYTLGDLATVNPKYTLTEGTWQALLRHRQKHETAGNGFGYSIADLDQPTRTLTARYGKDGQEILIPQDNANPRKLTPRECSRLMGMPQLQIPVSDTQAYIQLGNSVVPPLVEDLANHITG